MLDILIEDGVMENKMNSLKKNLDSVKTIYFIGIGGISMSGLAEIFQKRGIYVEGSDMKSSDVTEHLEQLGITVHIGHRADNILQNIDLVVYTAAISEDNPELTKARELGIECLERAALLGLLMDDYQHRIAVAGTHGKTSTTSMFAHILMAAKKDPTISLGGHLDLIDGNYRYGGADYFLLEACEYKNSFHHFRPSVSVILNIASDHMDFFKNYEAIRKSFKQYISAVPKQGTVVINSDIECWEELVEGVEGDVFTFGEHRFLGVEKVGASSSNSLKHKIHIFCEDIEYEADGYPSFTVFKQNIVDQQKYKSKIESTKNSNDIQGREGAEQLGQITLKVGGKHNVLNALAAVAGSLALGIDFETIKLGLEEFSNSKRRLEYKGEIHGVQIYDDYAHHPDEIRATLDALTHIEKNKLWIIFQPHTYTRTKALFDEFTSVFAGENKAENKEGKNKQNECEIILAPIYAAREKPIDVSSKRLHEALLKKGGVSHYFETFEEIRDFILKNAEAGDVVMTMGAGDIYEVGEMILQQ